ncbi:MAG: SMP-30/gluconolactonase/LRE family protein [Verrucomicrobia bacterium]|nr:SMP-30/gluconolactonase/LRE family protein [Verrucomicrobiota bacterium]
MICILLGGTCLGDGLGDLVLNGEAVKVAGGFSFTEGPVRGISGELIFSDIPTNRTLLRDEETGMVSVLRENTGGGNGMRIDHQGVLYTCEGTHRKITARFPDGTLRTVVDSFEGKPLNSPNDLWIDPHGGIYFTDPRYGDMNDLQQGGFHVYYKQAKSSRVVRVCGDLVKPNGIIGTSDGRTLYVSDLGDNRIYRYSVEKPGLLGEKYLFAEKGSDGMTLDSSGNVYLTQGAVHIYSENGKYIGAITTPEAPANVTFGGADRRTLYITARKSLYAIRMRVTGQ